MIDLRKAMDVARAAAEAGAAVALTHFEKGVSVELKADHSPVTAADRASEAAIVGTLRKAFPRCAILTEESGTLPGDPGARWIVDPLDGTRGFSRRGRFWGPLVALEQGGQVVAGAMAMPVLKETYWAAKGLGAWMNDGRLSMSEVSDWEDATLSLGELHRLLAPPWREAVLSLSVSCASSRCYGDLAACAMLLTGRADAWLEAGVKVWDLGPLKILVEEAGGVFTDLTGEATIENGHAAAANPKLHPHLLRAFINASER